MLTALLEKLGIKSITELKLGELATYTKWAEVLSKGDVTVHDLKKLLPIELTRAYPELRRMDNFPNGTCSTKHTQSSATNLMKMILGPAKERYELKAMLKQKYGIE